MPSYDERTPSGWPLPFKSNTLEFDVDRLRETLFLIDEALSAFREGTKTLLDERVAGLEEKQFILDDRMDVIAGQTTEDTEILDARVDANYETHPNLGHNIRNIHTKLLELKAELEQKEAELRTYIEEADAELREHADERDTELHNYVDEAKAEQAVTNAELRAYSEELYEHEMRQRKSADETLQHEISQSGEAIIETNLTLSREIRERKKSDAENAGAIQELREASTARDDELQTSLNAEKEYTAQRFSEQAYILEHESAERHAADTRLHEELKATSEHSTERDIELLRGLDELSAGVLQNTAALHHEADRRRKLEDVVAKIKSPVDWSKSTSLQIPEPRCAVVNISGITSMPTSKTAELNAVMEFWDMQGNFFRKNIVCSAQGNSSMSYPKKNVKFDLLNEDGSEFEMKIGSWPVQDGFHLKAFYTDFFRGVGAVSYKFCDEIMRFNGILSDRPYKKVLLDISSIKTSGTSLNNPDDLTLQTDTGALCHPDSFPCIVYLNGEFYGVFSWQIKKHRKNYHLEKSKVEHIHLDGSLYTYNLWDGTIKWTAFEIRNPNKLYTMNGKKYDGDAPKELIDETSANYDPENKDHVRSAQVKKYIQDFVARFGELKSLYASEGVSDIVRAKYEELFDWENQRDYLIFSDIIKNSDGFGKNWQWFTYDGVKWYVGAYDLDMSFGGDWQGRYITAPLTGHINTNINLPSGHLTRLYVSELEERYRELRDAGIINADHIARMLEDWTQRISTENYELEYERWPDSPCILKYTDSLYRVRKWLDTEIANMDKVYHYEPEMEQILSGLHGEIDGEIQTRKNETQYLESFVSMENRERQSSEEAIYEQLKTLGELNLRQELELHELRSAFREWVKVVNVIYQDAADTGELTYKGARIASGNEVTSMLSDVMTGKDSGEVSESEIPEELRDHISTSAEVTEMLSEVFSH